MDDNQPAEKIQVSRQAIEEAVTEAESLARLLDERGLDSYAETLRRWVVAPLDAEIGMAED